MSAPTWEQRAARASVVLDAWAEALRLDWSSIDGRACRSELRAVTAYLDGSTDALSFDDVGVCRCNGSTHWHRDAWDVTCPEVAAEAETDG